MKVIGLMGKAGTGKNFIAEKIQANLFPEDTCLLDAYAGPLKEACKSLFALTDEQVYTTEGKKQVTGWSWSQVHPAIRMDRKGFMTVREILQTVGTELMRDSWNQNHWVDLMSYKIGLAAQEGYKCFIITDVRFSNEVALIRKFEGQIWRVEGRQTEGIPVHASETYEIPNLDATIQNPPGTSWDSLSGPIKVMLENW